ncbi:glycerate kinase [Pseudomonas aeruginosa]|nr:glycerate kinase [Pseudomonas aeruginosa]
MSTDPRAFLTELFNTAVAAGHPYQVLADHLPEDRSGRAIVIGAGKAAGAMAEVVEKHWQGEIQGLVVAPYRYGAQCSRIEVVEASHPVPDDAGERVARRVLELISGLNESDRVIFLLSGGGSALLSLPAEGIGLADKQAVNKALLKSGAAIGEMNCVRKHLSAIKGGRLAKACWPASVYTYAISDVPGDEATVIASGPSVGDPTTSADALAILKRYAIDVPQNVLDWLADPRSETVKPDDPCLARSHFQLIATPQNALDAAAASRASPSRSPRISVELKGEPNIWALAGDTDGIDGSEDNAGALMTPCSHARGEKAGLKIRDELDDNNGYGYFQALGDLLVTGPTRTNVNDFRAILILES